MNEPKRYSEGGGDRLGIASLRAARGDTPPRGSKQRAIAALGVVGTAGAITATAKAAPALSLVRVLLSVVGVGAISAGLVTAGARWPLADTEAPVSSVTAPRSQNASAVVASPAGDGTVTAAVATVSPVATGPAVEPQRAPSAPPSVVSGSPRGSASGADAKRATLSDEVAALEVARAAVAARDATGALRALDRYRSDFPRGSLGQEATVLRMEALAQRGDRAAAAELARRFLTAHPDSPVADRVRSLGGLPSDAPATPTDR